MGTRSHSPTWNRHATPSAFWCLPIVVFNSTLCHSACLHSLTLSSLLVKEKARNTGNTHCWMLNGKAANASPRPLRCLSALSAASPIHTIPHFICQSLYSRIAIGSKFWQNRHIARTRWASHTIDCRNIKSPPSLLSLSLQRITLIGRHVSVTVTRFDNLTILLLSVHVLTCHHPNLSVLTQNCRLVWRRRKGKGGESWKEENRAEARNEKWEGWHVQRKTGNCSE